MLLSELLALGSAVCIALSAMLVGELGGRVPVVRLARWQMTAAFAATAVLASAVGDWSSLGASQVGLLAASGFFGITVASTAYYAAIYLAGPRVTALLFALSAPFALLLGYIVLGETISLMQAAGIGLILAGVVIAIGVRRRRPPAMLPLADAEPITTVAPAGPPLSVLGVSLGIVMALGQAVGTLLARPAMAAGAEPFAAMAVRSGLAVAFFWALLALPVIRREITGYRKADFGIAIVAGLVGTALGMSLLMAALQTGSVGIVTTLSSMTPIVILPMVWLRTGQMPRLHAWGGAGLAIVGTGLISFA